MDDRYYYRKYGRDFQLVDSDTGLVVAEGPAVAIAFDVRDFTLLKHGMPKRVSSWYERTQCRYLARGLAQEAADLVVIVAADWDVRDLERILTIDGYLKILCRRHGVSAGPRLVRPTVGAALAVVRHRRVGRLCCHLKPLTPSGGSGSRDRQRLRPCSRAGRSGRRSRDKSPALLQPPRPRLLSGPSLPC